VTRAVILFRWFSWVALYLLAACATPADGDANRILTESRVASHDAMQCRRSVADKPRYQQIAAHMPLVDPYRATLAQMTDSTLASEDDAVALGLWLQDIQGCRQQLVKASLHTFPTSLAILVGSWNKEDQIFVLLVKRKLVWGEAVARLRRNQAELLSALTDQAVRLSEQISSAKQAELTRRVSILNALTNLAP
jgi:hypothetical protein